MREIQKLKYFSPYSSEYQLLLTLAHLRNQKLIPTGTPILPTFSNPALFSPAIRKHFRKNLFLKMKKTA